MTNVTSVNLTPEETKALQSRMRDLQTAVSRYYAATGGQADFVPNLRAFITHAQTINDLLPQSISDNASYAAALDVQGDDDKALIKGIKCIRNVDQHLIHTVAPDPENVRLIGGTFEMRLFPAGKAGPNEDHNKLHRSTCKLKCDVTGHR